MAAPQAKHEPALARLKVADETTRARRAGPVFVLVEDRGTMGARRIKGVDNEDSEGTSGWPHADRKGAGHASRHTPHRVLTKQRLPCWHD